MKISVFAIVYYIIVCLDLLNGNMSCYWITGTIVDCEAKMMQPAGKFLQGLQYLSNLWEKIK